MEAFERRNLYEDTEKNREIYFNIWHNVLVLSILHK